MRKDVLKLALDAIKAKRIAELKKADDMQEKAFSIPEINETYEELKTLELDQIKAEAFGIQSNLEKEINAASRSRSSRRVRQPVKKRRTRRTPISRKPQRRSLHRVTRSRRPKRLKKRLALRRCMSYGSFFSRCLHSAFGSCCF